MIHRYQNNGYNIVLDVNSGAVHLVDSLVYEMLGMLGEQAESLGETCPAEIAAELSERYSAQAVDDGYGEIYRLYCDGLLYSTDDYEGIAEKTIISPFKAICLHVSHDCNLRCGYCFAGQGGYGSEKKLMSEEVALAAVDFLIENSGSRRNLEIDFFGGEPLLNFEAIKKTVEYGRGLERKHDKVFRFTTTTNGVLLNDEIADFLNREMHNVVLSLDGRREVNDRVRPDLGGGGSYDRIVPKYQHFARIRGDGDYYVRGTYTKNNLDFAEDVMHMYELGFDQISVEPVISDPGLPFSITEEDLPRIFDEYDRLARTVIELRKQGKGFNFFHFMIDLEQGPCVIKRLRGCGCGNEYAAVDPDGNLYPCHQFVGREEWKMGNVLTGGYDRGIKQRFAKSTVYDKAECRKCWAKFYCSGGCSANNFQYEGDILKPHSLSCSIEKKRLECAIMIKAALS